MYWFKQVSRNAHDISFHHKQKKSNTNEIAITALLGAIAAIFQSAGGFLPAIGYIISPLATAPIAISAIYSLRTGLLTYFLTILLLLIIQPSELVVFPLYYGNTGISNG